MSNTFRERLIALRDAADLSDYEVSHLAGLSSATAGHMLAGRRDGLSTGSVVALAKLFGVTTDYLLIGGEPPMRGDTRAAVERARPAPGATAPTDETTLDTSPEYVDPRPSVSP